MYMKQYSLTHLWQLLQITLLSLLVLMGALALMPVFQREAGPSAGGSTDIQGIETHVDHLSVNLAEYLENHQPDTLARVAREGKEITSLLDAYKNGLGADQLAVFSQLDEASRALRESTLQMIAADNSQSEDKARLADLQKQLKVLLDDMPRGPRAITRRLGTVAQRVTDIDIWQAKIEQDALQKTEWLQKFSKAYDELNKVLQESGSSLGPRPGFSSVFFRPGVVAGVIWVLGLCAGLCLLGLGWLLRFRMFQPLQDLAIAADAAAAGDLSGTPDIWAEDEIGQMAKALNRLTIVLARSENLVYHLATLVDSSGDGIISQTLEGTILSWNKGAQRIYGYSAEEVKGQPVTFLTPHEGAGQLTDVLERVKRGEKIRPFEMIHEGKNGRMVHVLLRVAAIYESTRKIIGVSMSTQDLTPADLLPERSTPPAKLSTLS
jgi:PAS domain S-box-containing protein